MELFLQHQEEVKFELNNHYLILTQCTQLEADVKIYISTQYLDTFFELMDMLRNGNV